MNEIGTDEGFDMSYAPISKAFFGVPEDDTNFNLPEAIKAYQTVMSMDDDAARYLVSSLVFDKAAEEISDNHVKIQKFVDDYYVERVEQITKALKRTYISKAAKGEDTASLEEAYEAITKAFDSRRHPRGGFAENPGQFSSFWGGNKRSSHAVSYTSNKPLPDKTALDRYGIDSLEKQKLSSVRKAEYQQAYHQIQQQLDRYSRAGLGKGASIQYIFEDNNGHRTEHISDGLEQPDWENLKNLSNKRLVEFHVHVPTDINVEGAGFNVLSAIGGTDAGVYGSEITDRIGPATRNFGQKWNDSMYGGATTEPFYNRLGAASELVDSLAPAGAFKTRWAAKTGKLVGEYGPEAEKVLGPHARKSAYRYRGVEKAPDQQVVAALANIKATSGGDRNVVRGHAIGGTVQGRKPGDLSREENGFIVGYLARRLPRKDLSSLQLKSGVTPPSQGFILDAKGNVVTEAVGYGDDHYLPFNLKNLGKLRGGEYIRTRSVGGPTTEDIYAGMISGARSLTVVSRSGVFTVNFDDTFRGSRRYNDKAARMVTRYGKLLDAVKNGELILKDISPERWDEIAAEAEGEYPYDEKRRKTYFKDKLDEARKNPTPSQSENRKIFERAELDSRGNLELRNRLIGEAQEAYVRDHKFETMKLDSNGYQAALLSLKEQFPYYFQTPQIRKLRESEDYEPRASDSGYVKPRYLRPEGALAGYFDTSIAGVSERAAHQTSEGKITGKVTADATNFANWRHNKLNPDSKTRVEAPQRADTSSSAAAGSGGAAAKTSTTAALTDDQKAYAAFEAYTATRAIGKFDGGAVADWVFGDELKKYAPTLTGRAISQPEFIRRFTTDPKFRDDFEADIQKLNRDDLMANSLMPIWRRYQEVGDVESKPYTLEAGMEGPANFDFGPRFPGPDASVDAYDRAINHASMTQTAEMADLQPGTDPIAKSESLINHFIQRINTRRADDATGRQPQEPMSVDELAKQLERAHQYNSLLRWQRKAARERGAHGTLMPPNQLN